MFWFFFKHHARTGYFVQLLCFSTLSMIVVQYLALRGARFAGAVSTVDTDLWLRAGYVGMWTVATVSAGMIGFQRYQGTLPYLLLTPRSTLRTMVPVISSASLLGLFAFPLAFLIAVLLRLPLGEHNPWQLSVGVLLFWLACMSLSLVIATVFVLTPNAITYEGLLVAPIVIASGIFGYAITWPGISFFSLLLPTTFAIEFERHGGWVNLGLCLLICVFWTTLAGILGKVVLARATRDGSLEVMG